MLRRPSRPVRALWAAGLLSMSVVVCQASAGEPGPAPGGDLTAETVPILSAQRSGDLAVTVRGQGEDRVKFSVRNTTARRLNVILPPGLVASSAASQGMFQSMGLGTPTTSTGGFGRFRPNTAEPGFRSIPAVPPIQDGGFVVPPGQTVEMSVPSVCLNYGIATPTARDQFTLMDVNDYSPDPRVRKALRSLATMGTSVRVAQAVMWNVSNGLPFPLMARQQAKRFNQAELTLAARFVEALDASSSADLVDPSALTQGRVLVRVQGDGPLYQDAKRLSSELEGQRILGLPVQVVTDLPTSTDQFSVLHLNVALTASTDKQTQGRVTVRHLPLGSAWTTLGQAGLKAPAGASELSAKDLADSVDRAVASALVNTKVVRHSTGATTIRIVNRLPFTLANVVVKAGRSDDAGRVNLDALGVGPGRSGLATIQAATGTVERVELNGL